jgi:hypothetical protein
MFLLASAFVAFQGWPQVAGQPSPVAVSIPRLGVPAGSRASRVLSAALTRPAAGKGARGAGAAAGTGARSHTGFNLQVHRATGSTTVTPTSRDTGSGQHTTGGPTTSPHTTCSSGCGHGSTGLLSSVRKTVSNTTAAAGSTVGNTVTTVKKILPKGGTGTSVGNVVTTTKKVVGGVVGGLP